ncbi:MAG TPA: amylo-alpha-1,6-glucosidase [Phycisphaerae bacterium]|nr:amylo-alpha-1,6-glucosidase [Phycisphaerae bacterium]
MTNEYLFDQKICTDLNASMTLEWLCTNGRGGFATGTVAGINTRKYHGYLVAAARPPVERYVLLSRVEDRIWIGEKSYPLSSNEFPDIIDPQGYRNLIRFELRTGPVWRYSFDGVIIEKSIVFLHDQDAVSIRYELVSAADGQSDIRLHLQPMLAGRHFHATTEANNRPAWNMEDLRTPTDQLVLSAPQCPLRLFISHNADRFSIGPCWWYNYVLREERNRGYPYQDDLWTPGVLEFALKLGHPVGLIGSVRPVAFAEQSSLIQKEQSRQQHLSIKQDVSLPAANLINKLTAAADQFLVYRSSDQSPTGKMSVIAGYPWFEDWGRDTFISLAGLTLVTGKFNAARSILVTFADHIRDGLVPNRFPDDSKEPDYNTVDASLWLVHAAYQYWRYSGDFALLKNYLYGPLCRILDAYSNGTSYGIRMDNDALIRAGEPGVQLTWMDAKIGWKVITPRYGKPVEINALWYNALRIMEFLAQKAGDPGRAALWENLAGRVQKSFVEKFWNKQLQCLYDVVGDDGKPDAAIRPNQILAISLPFSILSSASAKSVLSIVQRELLTPMGLRTLSPGSPGYCGRYQGNQESRDHAYHQGTVWPWLIGPFVSAYVKVNGSSPDVRSKAWEFLQPFEAHLRQAGIGSINEIADGDFPHLPRGCIAQAWSVGEVIRSCWEDVLGRAPSWPHETQDSSAIPHVGISAGAVKL